LVAAGTAGSARTRAIKLGLVVASAALIAAVNWTVEKKFVRALHRIAPGMTEAQVRLIMAGFPEGTGWPSNPFDPHTVDPSQDLKVASHLTFRPTILPGDSNWGRVELGSDARVVSVDFSPD
jgi:hypothetical protein